MKKFLAASAAALLLSSALSGPALAQDVTLKFMSYSPDYVEGTELWDKITAGFEAMHPGVQIESNFVPFPQYLTTLSAMIAGDSLPDIFYGHVKAAELGRAGLAVNWKDIVDADFLSQFFEGPIRLYTYDGSDIYALPMSAQLFGMFVNDRLMKELGLTIPNTWDELIAMSPKIHEAGLVPVAIGNLAKNVCPDFFLPLIAQHGGDAYALDDLSGDGVTWDSQAVIDSFALLQKLVKAGIFPEGANGIENASALQMAYQGKALMYYSGSWEPPGMDKEGSQDWVDNYSVQKVPALTADAVHYTGDGSGEALVVSSRSPNKDLAIDFVKYIFSPEVYRTFIAESGAFPSIAAALDSVSHPKVKTMVGWLNTDGANHILFGQGSWDAVSNACQGVLDLSLEPAAAAAQIQAEVLATRAKK